MKKSSVRLRTILAVLLAAMLHPGSAAAQDQPADASSTSNLLISAAGSTNRAAWQQHLTLGPGDILSLSLYGDPTPSEIWPNVVIEPDGRINYLEAREIPAAGLTIDELRTNLDAALLGSSNYLAPHVIITPVLITSKKYLVLGEVVNKGVFTLNRPMTVIEAIAQAGGLETGVFEHNTVELADLSHSFLVRDGHRLPIDFEKLFQDGDLAQNVPLEPGDYLYFASSGANELYVLGEVQSPGIVPFTPSSSIIGAITTRGSFTARAYRARVLIVRGSLSHPQTFVVNTSDILKGKTGNFRLMPRDIIFVSEKPWQFAEDLLDQATQAFITSLVVTYTGDKVGPFFSPIVH
ncbi:MAG TPA: SLBB domain-containing protein [Verrucomicrobiae bacterium]|jgi:polysaccharide export outer membrane protein|nr:SLBB domain-containing protein [Verrucomicrobiae bacterium]